MNAVIIDTGSNTIRPSTPEGDIFYGLLSGTNGTGPQSRRDAMAPRVGVFKWVTHNGRPAFGLNYAIPSGVFLNPWTLEESAI